MKNSTTYNNLLDLCISQHKIKGVIQKSILDILKVEVNKKSFLDFLNAQIRDKVFTDKVAKFQNNLNQKTTQESHFDIGEGESLTETIGLIRNPKSTLPQSERPYIFNTKEVKAKKVKTLEELKAEFKKKIAKEFGIDLTITEA